MESYLLKSHYDLITPDGVITDISPIKSNRATAKVMIENISPAFIGFSLDPSLIHFNIKSTLAQLGVDGGEVAFSLDPKHGVAEVTVNLNAIDKLGKAMLPLLEVGTKIGKLFAADPTRRVRDPDYLLRMLGRSDRKGRPLLSLGGMEGSGDLVFEVIDGRTVAFPSLVEGVVVYDDAIFGFLPTVAKALKCGRPVRDLVALHQKHENNAARVAKTGNLLLVKTAPLHIRTVFASVVEELLPQGFRHTSARYLQPDTTASGDIYELYGNSIREISDMPLEFYTLEPHREHVFFSDRDQLQPALDKADTLFNAFKTAPPPPDQAAVYVVKGTQLKGLTTSQWIARESLMEEFPGMQHGARQAVMVDRYIAKQAAFPFLGSMEEGLITSQGVLLTRYFPSPILKRMLLSNNVQRLLKGIYFQQASRSNEEFFSYEDRALLIDLAKFAIPTYWLDDRTHKILQFIQRPEKDSGMFVPLEKVSAFLKATFFGLYGSNLMTGEFENELRQLLLGILELRRQMNHPQLNAEIPLALVTGGGPGVMEIGNKLAQETGYISCANIIDFRLKGRGVVNEQMQNSYIDAKMTYRLDKLVERQAEFHLDFPIFLQGGIGTDFELALEEVGRKVGASPAYPVLLFGTKEYWYDKIGYRFRRNLATGTIKGSEWISNTFYCVENAQEGLDVYRRFFEGKLPIGHNGPIFEDGFVVAADLA